MSVTKVFISKQCSYLVWVYGINDKEVVLLLRLKKERRGKRKEKNALSVPKRKRLKLRKMTKILKLKIRGKYRVAVVQILRKILKKDLN